MKYGVTHGFLATPSTPVPEPSTLALFGAGIIGLRAIAMAWKLDTLMLHLVALQDTAIAADVPGKYFLPSR